MAITKHGYSRSTTPTRVRGVLFFMTAQDWLLHFTHMVWSHAPPIDPKLTSHVYNTEATQFRLSQADGWVTVTVGIE